MNVFPLTLKNFDGETITLSLRLTTGGQRTLKNKYPDAESTTDILFSDDIAHTADVLTEALRFRGNSNSVTDGDELLDLLADNDMGGSANRMRLMGDIALVSGIFDKASHTRFKKRIDQIESDAAKEPDEGNA